MSITDPFDDDLTNCAYKVVTMCCSENLTDGTSSHDWPITNLATGQVGGLCWFCGCSAKEFYERVKQQRKAETQP